ncbi:MAG: hypothetical protein WCT85_04775 [Parachlamydiales bacterium]|jgi:hypothetical protein
MFINSGNTTNLFYVSYYNFFNDIVTRKPLEMLVSSVALLALASFALAIKPTLGIALFIPSCVVFYKIIANFSSFALAVAADLDPTYYSKGYFYGYIGPQSLYKMMNFIHGYINGFKNGCAATFT